MTAPITYLAIGQRAAKRLQIAEPSVLGSSQDNNIILLRQCIVDAAREIKDRHDWPELYKELDFTLSNGVNYYALPYDLDKIKTETLWNRTQATPLFGPLSAIEWQEYKSGNIGAIANQRFRVKGISSTQLYIDPTPGSEEDGQTCVMEYISENLWRPRDWAVSTVFSAATYCFYNGRVYYTSAGGTTGAGETPPTHTSGSVSGGVVTWTYQTGSQDTTAHTYRITSPNADTDISVLHPDLVANGAVWRFKRERGLDYQEQKDEYEQQIDLFKTKLSAAPLVCLRGGYQEMNPFSLRRYPTDGYLE